VTPLGTVVWITGIPAAGKTSLAHALAQEVRRQGRSAVCIDGDDLRAGLSGDLGFDEDGRRESARRAAELSREAALDGAVALTSLVSPFRRHRAAARATIESAGLRFVEVFVDTPLEVCRRRDPKGLYAAAAAGRLSGLTGWDAPYERPADPEVHLGSGAGHPSIAESARQVLAELRSPTDRVADRRLSW
jgi:adenylyl-sulfate kinase